MSNPGGLDPEKLFSMSNSYRSSKGLPAFQKDPRVCEVARVRAPAIEAEIRNGVMHSGLKAMGLPYWITENIISYSTEEQAFNWWAGYCKIRIREKSSENTFLGKHRNLGAC